jgi:polar amino acid transport system substrate-binding protein
MNLLLIDEQRHLISKYILDASALLASLQNEDGYEIVDTMLPEVLNSVRSGESDLAIGAISITSDRYKEFNFSYPFYQGGLQILVPIKKGGNISILTSLFSPSLLQLVGWVLLASLVPVHIVWWVERNIENGIVHKAYFPGIFQSMWWILSTLATQAESMPKSWIGRVVAIFWMFTGVIFVAYFTATVTAALTVQQLQSNIRSIDDLHGKNVVTVIGSTSSAFLQARNIQATIVNNSRAGYDLLESGQSDAMVFDAPVIQYYAANEGKGKVETVGEVFETEYYGILLPLNSPYTRQINQTILKLEENGTIQKLNKKWFSSNS